AGQGERREPDHQWIRAHDRRNPLPRSDRQQQLRGGCHTLVLRRRRFPGLGEGVGSDSGGASANGGTERRPAMIGLRRVLAGASVALTMAGGGGSTGPVAGMLIVKLTTPNSGSDGAVMLVLSSPVAPTSVAAGTGLALWGAPVTSLSAKLVVTGTL